MERAIAIVAIANSRDEQLRLFLSSDQFVETRDPTSLPPPRHPSMPNSSETTLLGCSTMKPNIGNIGQYWLNNNKTKLQSVDALSRKLKGPVNLEIGAQYVNEIGTK